MTPLSLPPSDRNVADGDPEPVPVAQIAKTYPRNEKVWRSLEDWLAAFHPDERPTNVVLASRLSYSDGVLSQYRAKEGNKYPGDTKKLERAISLFLRAESRPDIHSSPPNARTLSAEA
jgi:hypothetical protein